MGDAFGEFGGLRQRQDPGSILLGELSQPLGLLVDEELERGAQQVGLGGEV